MRFEFVKALSVEMQRNDSIFVLLGDLGYGIFDKLRIEFPDRCINVGSSEQLMLGMATGMAFEGKIPVCYSISPFLIYRPFEFIRNYLDHEQVPVKLVGSGRGTDYMEAGFTHYSVELQEILSHMKNIESFWPETTFEMENTISSFLYSRKPSFLSLRR